MRGELLKMGRVRLVSTVAVMIVTGLAAGCSADVARFDDGFYTGAVPQASVGQGVDQVNTGSVNRGLPMPGYGASGARLQQAAPAYPTTQATPSYGTGAAASSGIVRAAPTRVASIERTELPAPTAMARPAVEPAYRPEPARVAAAAPARPATAASPAGWHDTGNTVTLRDGETVAVLANRYGVPEKAILGVNGLKSGSDVQAGRAIIIPAYSYGASPSAARVASAAGTQQLGTPPGPLRVPSPEAPPMMAEAHKAGPAKVAPTRVASLEPKAAVAPSASMGAAPAPLGQTQQPKAYEPPHKAEGVPAKAAAPVKPAPAKVEAKIEAPKPAAEPVVKAAPAAPAIAEAPKTSVAAEVDQDVASATPAGTGIDQFRWPVQGRIVKRYGDKIGARRNDGVNISVPRGTPVKAAENGVVIYAGDGLKEFGNTVLVKHDNGLVTVYGYADEIKVARGATVHRGQEIATAGMSGDADTPMVHFEVRKNSAPVDPMTYLQ